MSPRVESDHATTRVLHRQLQHLPPRAVSGSGAWITDEHGQRYGGYQPIGAVLAQGHIVATLAEGSGLFQHGHTYLGHAVACAAALAVQRVIERDQLLPLVLERGRQLQRWPHGRPRAAGAAVHHQRRRNRADRAAAACGARCGLI